MQKTLTNFYAPPANISGEVLFLSGEEAQHLTKVLRAKRGDTISVADGCGMVYRAIVQEIGKGKVTASIINQVRRENEAVVNVTLAFGIPAGPKADWIIEKCTELGVKAFIPLSTQNTLVEFRDQSKTKRKLSRWNNIAIAAMKQSLRCYLPKVEDPHSLAALLGRITEFDRAFLAHLSPQSKKLKEVLPAESGVRDVLLLAGPESGLTADEVELCQAGGFIPIRVGPRRLRAETACIAVCGQLLTLLGELE